MSKRQKRFIKILNPSGSSPYTHLARALRYVELGRAKWEGDAIRLTDNWLFDCRMSAILHRAKMHRLRTMDEAGYDGIGLITLDQMQGLPLAGPAIRLISKGPRNFTPRAPARGKVKRVMVTPHPGPENAS